MSRCCFGDVSVMSSCLCVGSVMSRCCFGDVSVMSQSCLGRLSVVSRSCPCLFLVMSSCCFGVVLLVFGWCFGDLSVMRWWLATSRARFGEVSVMCGDGAVMFMMMSG